jgi:hypothetical protein
MILPVEMGICGDPPIKIASTDNNYYLQNNFGQN